VIGSLKLLDVMRTKGLDKIIFSSSAAVYGLPEKVPIPEDHPLAPINPYGFSKLAVERFLREFDSAYGLRSVSLRYFNACGADPEGETGEAHDPETHLIPRVLGAVLGTITDLTVYGEDYDTPDGTCIRDYIHVTDLADAHVRALENLIAGGPSAAYNLGVGHGYSVREIIDAAEGVTGRSISFQKGPRRAGDPARLVSESSRAARALGWTPKHSDLQTIIRTAWRWMNGSRQE
jgi:UDP-glucose-4-epimerase GalE